jgi:hypothetical protein
MGLRIFSHPTRGSSKDLKFTVDIDVPNLRDVGMV